MNSSLANNTKGAYATGVDSFERFRANYKLQRTWPPKIEDITLFIAWLSMQELSHSTARLYVNAVGFQCKVNNHDDVTRNFVIQKALEGLKRSGSGRKARLPITPNILTAVLSTLPGICLNKYEACLFNAAFSLAFFAFLRISELAVVNRRSASNVIFGSDVEVDDGSITLLIRHSKTDQYGDGVRLKLNITGSELCPVVSLKKYLHQRPLIKGPLFCHLNGSPLTRYQFTAILKRCLCRLKLDFGCYTSHSFRIGAATAAAMAGWSVDAVKQAGRWRSEAYKIYIKPDLVHTLPKLI